MARVHRVWVGVVAAVALVVGCEPQVVRQFEPVPPGSVTVIFLADNQGVLSACGCPSNPSGGFAKRQTVIEETLRRRPNVVVVDAGDLFPERSNPLKVKYLAAAVARAGYDAIALGDQELALGVPGVQALAGEGGLPLICANVSDEAGTLVVPPHVVREVGGCRIGIFAVVGEAVQAVPPREWRTGLKIESPIDAARQQVRDLADCDLVIALSHQTMADTEELARSVPGIHVVVSGHDETVLRQPVKVGDALIVATGALGRQVGTLTWRPVPEGAPEVAMDLAGLSQEVHDSKWVLDLYWQYVRESKGKAPPEWDLTPVPPAYEPAENCKKCHEKEYAQWATTDHSHAYETIKKAGRHEDPECILCHTMGYGRQGGFVSAKETPGLARVTCQACHPVVSEHGKKGERPGEQLEARLYIRARLCMSCHGLIESPDFDYRLYRPKVVHGVPAAETAK